MHIPKIATILSLVSAASVAAVPAAARGGATSVASVSYDRGYDEPDRSMTAVGCSDGTNGLITRYKWSTQGNIPVFPYIGGAEAVAGWNSPNCGTCWKLEYKGKTINVLAVDHAKSGFNIGLRAMDALTDGQSIMLGRVNVNYSQVPISACGL